LPLGTRDDLADGFSTCSLRFGYKGQPMLDTARLYRGVTMAEVGTSMLPSISTVIAAVVTGKRRCVFLTTYLTTGAVLSLTRAALAFGLWRTTPRTALGAREDQGI
jgi:hypothetical protein